MTEKTRIAVPVESGEGLNATRSAHFGHAPSFAIVDVADGAPLTVEMLPNPPHSHGGCGATVGLLAANGVQAVSAAGMGRGPLNGLVAAGIVVHHDAVSVTVSEAIEAILAGTTSEFGTEHACRGHHH